MHQQKIDFVFEEEQKEAIRMPITPIEKYGCIYLKRDDLFMAAGAVGAKARSCFFLIQQSQLNGYNGITTAGSRSSPQINICAQIAKRLKMRFVAHAPMGELSEELLDAKENGAEIIQHKAGYNNVIIARCRDYAKEHNLYEVPFGMKTFAAVTQTKNQVVNIPSDIKRIVIVVGSGMNLCGLLHGLKENKLNIPVVGVVVGASPVKTLDAYAPTNWSRMVTLVNAGVDYHHKEEKNEMFGVVFDPIYEAKCFKFLQDGDLFWVVGIRKTLVDKNSPDYNYFK